MKKFSKIDFWKERADLENKYIIKEDENIIVYCLGYVVGVFDDRETCDFLQIAYKALEGALNYNNLYGNYRIVVFDKKDESYLFFGDNSGSLVFFIDEKYNLFSDSLLGIRNRRKGDLSPNYYAILQLLQGWGMFSLETILEGVVISDSEKIYRYKNGLISEESKKLYTLSENNEMSLDRLMDIIVKRCNKEDISSVCTGGTDSRVILSHLIKLGVFPELIITGHAQNPDIKVSEEIAKTLGLKLNIMDPSKKEENWLKKGFEFSDGLYDTVLSYRHMKKCEWSQKKRLGYEFGGVGGEFYKNSFCRPFLDCLFFKKISPELIIDKLFRGGTVQESWWYGEKLKPVCRSMKDYLLPITNKCIENSMLRTFNRTGMRMLQGKSVAITNNMAVGCIKIDPLMERKVISSVSKLSPYRLSMHIWQRKQIERNCHEIASIQTDQGYSCSTNFIKLTVERIKKLVFYITRIFARIKRKFGLKYVDSTLHYWDVDYEEAINTEIFSSCIESLKKIGILAVDVTSDDLPKDKVGIILQVGMFFENNFKYTI